MTVDVVSIPEFIRLFRGVYDYSFSREDIKKIKRGCCHNLDVVATLLPPSVAVVENPVYTRIEYDAPAESRDVEVLLVCAIRGRLVGCVIKGANECRR